jgi:hypothetical protein
MHTVMAHADASALQRAGSGSPPAQATALQGIHRLGPQADSGSGTTVFPEPNCGAVIGAQADRF